MNLRAPNHFDFLRFLAASLVLFSHSFMLTGMGTLEPLAVLSGHRTDLGHVAVAIFFALSGFLIAGSWDKRRHFPDFISARIVRILPGLAVMLLICIAVGAVITTEPAAYPVSALTYFVRNLLMFKGQGELPGVFQHNILSPVLNGSLWTLRLEFTCYLLVALLGMLRMLNTKVVWGLWLLVLVTTTLHVPLPNLLRELLPLALWFLAGMLAYLYRELAIAPRLLLASAGAMLALMLVGVPLDWLSPLLSLLLIRLAYLHSALVRFGKFGDFSYGIYIYAFPTQQFFVWLRPELSWWQNCLLAYPVTLALSILSWHLIEKRALRLRLGNYLTVPASKV
jgi:peptidoglycan/LPS O-acetylase OafA/YrhL